MLWAVYGIRGGVLGHVMCYASTACPALVVRAVTGAPQLLLFMSHGPCSNPATTSEGGAATLRHMEHPNWGMQACRMHFNHHRETWLQPLSVDWGTVSQQQVGATCFTDNDATVHGACASCHMADAFHTNGLSHPLTHYVSKY